MGHEACAERDLRGEFNPIKTKVPGIEICEHLADLTGEGHG
jgi:hypothetical protein